VRIDPTSLAHSRWVWPLYQRSLQVRWIASGRRGAPPHLVKEAIVRRHAKDRHLDVLVETGTYFGDMVWALRNEFSAIHSIELDPALANRARQRFARFSHIHIYEGDSAAVLPGIIALLDRPALFWLDGHYSGGITTKAAQETPISSELQSLLSDGNRDNVILIDDARAFTGDHDYPTVAEIAGLVAARKPAFRLQVADDVIRITPP
jgi:hypothetical protein